MPNVSAFQKADRLALLGGMHDFFDALSKLPTSWDTTRVALLIRRCEYEGNPADVKTLESLLGWSKTKVLVQLKELEQYGFEFKAVKDENDHRRSVQRLYGRENPATTLFFQRCSDLVDKMVEAREAAKALRTEPTPTALPQPEKPKARFGWKRRVGSAAAAWIAAWLVFDTDKIDDLGRLETMLMEVVKSPAEQFFDYPDLRARDTTVRFAMANDLNVKRML